MAKLCYTKRGGFWRTHRFSPKPAILPTREGHSKSEKSPENSLATPRLCQRNLPSRQAQRRWSKIRPERLPASCICIWPKALIQMSPRRGSDFFQEIGKKFCGGPYAI